MSFDHKILVFSSVCVMSCTMAAESQAETSSGTEHIKTASSNDKGATAISGLSLDNFRTQNNEVIVAILLRGQTILNEAMQAYLLDDDIALPLEQIMLLLEFPIQVTTNGAKGWFISEKRKFLLDRVNGMVQSDGQSFHFSSNQLRSVNGELYIPSRLLSQWLPIEFEANLRSLEVSITPRENIAVDERSKRKNKGFGTSYYVHAVNEEQQTPYQMLGIPALEVGLQAGRRSTRGDDQGFQGTYSIRAATDIAYMSGMATLFGDQDGLTDARINLSRRDPRGRLLGTMDATEFELGDITTRSAPLIAGSEAGRGVHVARRPADYVGAQETVTLEGLLENGYEVELYRNDILINADRTGSGTSYNFPDIALFGGQNELRLEFYGPQGQRRTETKRYYMGNGQLKKGEIQYDIAVSQPDKTVLGVADDINDRNNDPVFGLPDDTNDHTNNKVAATAMFDYGLSSRISVSGGIAQVPLQDSDEIRRYGVAGINTQLGGVYTTLNTAVDDKGGSAIGLGMTTTRGQTNLSARYERYLNEFVSNKTSDIDADEHRQELTSKTTLDIDTYQSVWLQGFSLDAGLGASHLTYREVDSNSALDGRLTAAYKNVTFNQTVKKSWPSIGKSSSTGSSQLNLNLLDTTFRASSDYDIAPDWQLRNRSAGISRNFGKYNAALEYREDKLAGSEYLSASLSREFSGIQLGISASRTRQEGEDEDSRVFLTASFSTFSDSKTRKTHFSGSASSNKSAVRATAFLDENQNGSQDAGEKGIPDVRFSGYDRKLHPTGSDGSVLLTNARTYDWSDINIDTSGLLEPNWNPGSQGVSVLPRPGMVSEVEIPVIITADIEGSITLEHDDKEATPLANIEVQAVRNDPETGKEEVLAVASTAFDGFYSMAGVPVGKITLRINPNQAKRLAIQSKTSIPLILSKEAKLLEKQDFKLTRNMRISSLDKELTHDQ